MTVTQLPKPQPTLSDRLSRASERLLQKAKKDPKYGRLITPLLRLASGLGAPTTFRVDKSDAEIRTMIDTGIEVLSMLRDNDPTSDDPTAVVVYAELFGTDTP